MFKELQNVNPIDFENSATMEKFPFFADLTQKTLSNYKHEIKKYSYKTAIQKEEFFRICVELYEEFLHAISQTFENNSSMENKQYFEVDIEDFLDDIEDELISCGTAEMEAFDLKNNSQQFCSADARTNVAASQGENVVASLKPNRPPQQIESPLPSGTIHPATSVHSLDTVNSKDAVTPEALINSTETFNTAAPVHYIESVHSAATAHSATSINSATIFNPSDITPFSSDGGQYIVQPGISAEKKSSMLSKNETLQNKSTTKENYPTKGSVDINQMQHVEIIIGLFSKKIQVHFQDSKELQSFPMKDGIVFDLNSHSHYLSSDPTLSELKYACFVDFVKTKDNRWKETTKLTGTLGAGRILNVALSTIAKHFKLDHKFGESLNVYSTKMSRVLFQYNDPYTEEDFETIKKAAFLNEIKEVSFLHHPICVEQFVAKLCSERMHHQNNSNSELFVVFEDLDCKVAHVAKISLQSASPDGQSQGTIKPMVRSRKPLKEIKLWYPPLYSNDEVKYKKNLVGAFTARKKRSDPTHVNYLVQFDADSIQIYNNSDRPGAADDFDNLFLKIATKDMYKHTLPFATQHNNGWRLDKDCVKTFVLNETERKNLSSYKGKLSQIVKEMN